MKRVFTLIEMLVVIAIISILASMLAPALRRALDAANYVNCTNNQRQQMIAVSMWAGEHNGYVPSPGGQNTGQRCGFADLVFQGAPTGDSCLIRGGYLSDGGIFVDRPGLSHPTYLADWGGWKGPNEAFFYGVPIYVIGFFNDTTVTDRVGAYRQNNVGWWWDDAGRRGIDAVAVSRVRLNGRYVASFSEIPYTVCRVNCSDAIEWSGWIGNGRGRLVFCKSRENPMEVATHGDITRNPIGFLDGHAKVTTFNAMDGECPSYDFNFPFRDPF